MLAMARSKNEVLDQAAGDEKPELPDVTFVAFGVDEDGNDDPTVRFQIHDSLGQEISVDARKGYTTNDPHVIAALDETPFVKRSDG